MLTTINILECLFPVFHVCVYVCILPYNTLMQEKKTLKNIFPHPIKYDFAPNLAGLGLLANVSLEIVKDSRGLHSRGKLGMLLIFSPLCSQPSQTIQRWRLLGIRAHKGLLFRLKSPRAIPTCREHKIEPGSRNLSLDSSVSQT